MLFLLMLPALQVEGRSLRVYGYVVDSENVGIELANVYISETVGTKTIGTTTNKNGYYDLQFSDRDTVTLVFSMLGYVTTEQRLWMERDVVNVNVMLPTDAEALEEVEVRGIKKQTGTFEHTEAAATRIMPDATGGGIESLMITFAGVRQNNELSSQYNVRGGSFDENSVYVNGIEVYRPLLIRAGQQEGLSFVNPDMTETVSFSAGGFDARYGDKMSSVLDITYKQPNRTEATLSLSLLGANAYVGFGNNRHSEMHSVRYKTSRYMLGALPTAGSYQPNFIDYQTAMTWKLGERQKKQAAEDLAKQQNDWEINLLANVSQNTYSFRPDSVSTTFGGLQDSKKLNIWYDGREKDVFRTVFAAIGAQGTVGKDVHLNFTVSGFYTNEHENYDITGEYLLSDNPMNISGSGQSEGSSSGNNTAQKGSEMPQGEVTGNALGKGTYHEHARNTLQAGVVKLEHQGSWKKNNNTLNWGASVQGEMLSDVTSEWQWRDSAGFSLPATEGTMALKYVLKGRETLNSIRVQGYIQDTYKWNTDAGNILLTGGVRFHWWSINHEPLFSPRACVVYMPGWKRDLTLRLATGLYYQAPFYKELKDTLTGSDGITRITLNHKIRAQRSAQVVLGADYYFRAWGRPFKFTAEAYYKHIDRMISYTVDNVRVRYSGQNDATGYSTGLDLKLFGELVPGADSWVSFSLMRSRQRLINHPEAGWLLGPQEQRYAFSMLFQDYFPKLPQLKFHIKFVFSDGLPYSLPSNIAKQGRMPAYKRVDIGATYAFRYGRERWMKNPHVEAWWLQFEVFNIADFKNVNSYFYVPDYYGNTHLSPNYLTGRMYNFKMTLDLK
ncbi:MAG: TonB-dependent receptor [Paludibacteraceae bacterium]|nr:TonB-dependent receptor [Paludibacteraceae bacterium]